MTNTALFREAVENAGVEYKFLAKTLGITPYGLQKRLRIGQNSRQARFTLPRRS